MKLQIAKWSLLVASISAFSFFIPASDAHAKRYRTCDQNSAHVINAKAYPYQNIINRASRRYGVDANLIKAVITAETCFRSRATSHKGAGGLMQLMPATAKRFGVTNRYNVYQNIYAGTKYLRWLLNRYNGSVHHAVAAYNAGEGRVDRYGANVPFKETRNYLVRVMNAFRKLSRANGRGHRVHVRQASYRAKKRQQRYKYNAHRQRARAGMILGGTGRSAGGAAAKQAKVISGSGRTLSCKMIPRSLYRMSKVKNRGNIRTFYYTAKKADRNIDLVARRTGRKVQDILSFNRLPSRSIKSGQTIKVAQCHL